MISIIQRNFKLLVSGRAFFFLNHVFPVADTISSLGSYSGND